MRTLFSIVLIFLFTFNCFSQSKASDQINDEYYGLKWGCSIKELISKYPAAYAQGSNDDGDELYYLETNGVTRIFFFGNGKLYMGRVVYSDCSNEKILALMSKVVEKYGKFDSSEKGSAQGSEYLSCIRDYSSIIKIECQVVSLKNSYGYNISQAVFINYVNKNLLAKIAKERIHKMQGDLEL